MSICAENCGEAICTDDPIRKCHGQLFIVADRFTDLCVRLLFGSEVRAPSKHLLQHQRYILPVVGMKYFDVVEPLRTALFRREDPLEHAANGGVTFFLYFRFVDVAAF